MMSVTFNTKNTKGFDLPTAVCQAIQVLKPYKYDKNIMWVYAITGRLRQEVNNPFSLSYDQL